MQYLQYLKTNIGVIAVRRHPNAELRYLTQAWQRKNDGEWKPLHYFPSENESAFSPKMLEALYQLTDKESIPREDGW